MNQFEEKTLKRKEVFEGKIISLHVDEVSLPNGKTSTREIVKHPGAVAIIPITHDNKIVFVKQFRKPLERSLVEIPAGRIEVDEAPERTAVRELEEETGYTTNNITYISSFYTSPGFADELIHIYLTDELQRLDTCVKGDEDEFVELIELTLDEAEQLMKENVIYDAKTIYALEFLKNRSLKDE